MSERAHDDRLGILPSAHAPWSPVWALGAGAATASLAILLLTTLRNRHPNGLFTPAGEVHADYRETWAQCIDSYDAEVCLRQIEARYYPWYLEHDLWVALGIGIMAAIIIGLGMIATTDGRGS